MGMGMRTGMGMGMRTGMGLGMGMRGEGGKERRRGGGREHHPPSTVSTNLGHGVLDSAKVLKGGADVLVRDASLDAAHVHTACAGLVVVAEGCHVDEGLEVGGGSSSGEEKEAWILGF